MKCFNIIVLPSVVVLPFADPLLIFLCNLVRCFTFPGVKISFKISIDEKTQIADLAFGFQVLK